MIFKIHPNWFFSVGRIANYRTFHAETHHSEPRMMSLSMRQGPCKGLARVDMRTQTVHSFFSIQTVDGLGSHGNRLCGGESCPPWVPEPMVAAAEAEHSATERIGSQAPIAGEDGVGWCGVLDSWSKLCSSMVLPPLSCTATHYFDLIEWDEEHIS